MYFLFRFKNVLPIEYANMGQNEKMIMKIFMIKELEDKEKEYNNVLEGGE